MFPDGEAAFLLRTANANAAELDRHSQGDGAAWRDTLDGFLPNADLSFGMLGTELWSGAGATLAAKATRRLGRRGLAEFAGNVLISSRDWLEDTSPPNARTGCSHPGCSTPVSGRTPRPPGSRPR